MFLAPSVSFFPQTSVFPLSKEQPLLSCDGIRARGHSAHSLTLLKNQPLQLGQDAALCVCVTLCAMWIIFPPSCGCNERKEPGLLERLNSLSNYSFQWLCCKTCFVSAQVLAERSLNNLKPRVLGLFVFDLSFFSSLLSLQSYIF